MKNITLHKTEYIEQIYVIKHETEKKYSFNKTLLISNYKKSLTPEQLAPVDQDTVLWTMEKPYEKQFYRNHVVYSNTDENIPKIGYSLRNVLLLNPKSLEFINNHNLLDTSNNNLFDVTFDRCNHVNLFTYKLVVESVLNSNNYKYILCVKSIEFAKTIDGILVGNEIDEWQQIGSGFGNSFEISSEIYTKYINRYEDIAELYLNDILNNNIIGYEHNNIFYNFAHFDRNSSTVYGNIIPNNGKYFSDENECVHSVCITEEPVFFMKKDIVYYSGGRVYFNSEIRYTQDSHPDVIKFFEELHYKSEIEAVKILFPTAIGYNTNYCSGSLN